jgi:hypothetical protein
VKVRKQDGVAMEFRMALNNVMVGLEFALRGHIVYQIVLVLRLN